MIVFDLACGCGFVFEGWFKDREDFLNQQQAELLSCPACGGNEIQKILSPVHLQGGAVVPVRPQPGPEREGISPDDKIRAMRMLQDYIVKNFEDVGADLTAESLKIHYGVEKPRNIRGVATEEEEKMLKDEGINLLKIPMPIADDKIN